MTKDSIKIGNEMIEQNDTRLVIYSYVFTNCM